MQSHVFIQIRDMTVITILNTHDQSNAMPLDLDLMPPQIDPSWLDMP